MCTLKDGFLYHTYEITDCSLLLLVYIISMLSITYVQMWDDFVCITSYSVHMYIGAGSLEFFNSLQFS